MRLLLIAFFSSVFAQNYYDELRILTTYQAEDYGLRPESHYQCRSWQLWKRTREEIIDLRPSDIDLLALRRNVVRIRTWSEAQRFHVPHTLLRRFRSIFIDFFEVCQLHPRVLRIASKNSARRYHLEVEKICGNSISINHTLPWDENIIWTNTTSDLQKYGLPQDLLIKHIAVAIFPIPVCVNRISNITNDKEFYEDTFGQFSFDVSQLDVNVETLVNEMESDFEESWRSLDKLFEKLNADIRPLPATQILPWLKKVRYDARSPPTLIAGRQVTIWLGLHIQSIGNFELSTMDYDMDAWIRMGWRDPRLRHGYSRPVLINEYSLLKKIWRPDPVFTNTKEATFHKVSYLNFYMFIFPGGQVFLDIRVFLKPTASKIVLCKYPHDEPACSLKISSFGITQEAMRFEWFPNDAIIINRDVQIPDLMLLSYDSGACDGQRKSGNYSCLEAHFRLRREIGYHVAHTYVPTAICVLFSMVSVWLPEEFVEGRIFVSLTVFLTLSAENNAAKDELPKVSYVKAIDIWFGFTSFFVFMTMLQALIVISLETHSKNLVKKCKFYIGQYSSYKVAKMMLKSRYLHRWARHLDTFCKVMYPVTFILFTMIYRFVIIEGAEDKCIK